MSARNKLQAANAVHVALRNRVFRRLYRLAWTLHKAMCRTFDSSRFELRNGGSILVHDDVALYSLGGYGTEGQSNLTNGGVDSSFRDFGGNGVGYRSLRNRQGSDCPGSTLGNSPKGLGCSPETLEKRWRTGMRVLDLLWPLLFILFLAVALKLSHAPEKNRYTEQFIGPLVSQEK